MLKRRKNIDTNPMSKENNDMYQKPNVLANYIDAFIRSYYLDLVKDKYTELGEKHEIENIRNFIEKMAVWYELKYPSYEVNRLIPGSIQESKNISDIMFYENPYVNRELDKDNEARVLEWSSFYNADTFIKSLPGDEKYYFAPFYYPDIVYITYNAHLHLNRDGTVDMAEGISNLPEFEFSEDADFEGKHFDEIMQILNEHGVELINSEFMQVYKKEQKHKEFQKNLLACVMYRILERGGNRIGPRRAFLFAKEFNCDIRVPLRYGIDLSDPGLRLFINEYIKAGGKTDLRCYVDYCNRLNDNERLMTFTITELLRFGRASSYTQEEVDLQKKLIETLKKALDEEKLRRTKIEALRLERKLAKSRTNRKRPL